VRAAIAAASTPEDVDRIERQLKAGILPAVKKAVAPAVATPLAPSHASAMVVEEDAPAPPPHASDKEVADSSAPMPAAPVVTAPVVESVATAPVVVAAPVAEPVAAAPVVAAPVVEPVAAATVVVELPPIDQEPSAKSEAELKSAADCDDGEMKDESATTESFPILTEEEASGGERWAVNGGGKALLFLSSKEFSNLEFV
jgi:ribonuclease E